MNLKNLLVVPALLLLGSCQSDSPTSADNSKTTTLSARVELAAGASSALYDSATTVRVSLTAGSYSEIQTPLFSAHGCDFTGVPVGVPYTLSFQGLNQAGTMIWSGTATGTTASSMTNGGVSATLVTVIVPSTEPVKLSVANPASSGLNISGPSTTSLSAQLALPVSQGGINQVQARAKYVLLDTLYLQADNTGNTDTAVFGSAADPQSLLLLLKSAVSTPDTFIIPSFPSFKVAGGQFENMPFPVQMPLSSIDSLTLKNILSGNPISVFVNGKPTYYLINANGVVESTGQAIINIASGTQSLSSNGINDSILSMLLFSNSTGSQTPTITSLYLDNTTLTAGGASTGIHATVTDPNGGISVSFKVLQNGTDVTSGFTISYTAPVSTATSWSAFNDGNTKISANTGAANGTDTLVMSIIDATNSGTATAKVPITVTGELTGRSDSTLSALSTNPGTFTAAFSSSTLSYTDSVASGTSSLTVTATANTPADVSSITYNGQSSSAVALSATDPTAIQIQVTNKNGRVLAYTIKVYHKNLAVLSSPSFNLLAGSYTGTQSVAITAPTGAIVYYTVNGSTPTTSSTAYSGPITVSSTETIKAIAVESGMANSAVTSASYTITPPSVIVHSNFLSGQTFAAPYRVHLFTDSSVDTTGLTIHLTLNGIATTSNSTAIKSGTGFTLASPVQIYASPWRGGVQLGPDQIFTFNMDSCIYNFDGVGDSSILSDTSSFGKTVGVGGYTYSTGTGTYSITRIPSQIAMGSEVDFAFNLSGTTYPSTGFVLTSPSNPVKNDSGIDYSHLVSISVTLRETRVDTSKILNPLTIILDPPPTDTFETNLNDQGGSYEWTIPYTPGIQKLNLSISNALFHPNSTTGTPESLNYIMKEFGGITIDETCLGSATSDGACSNESGSIEIDNLTYHFQ
jgi:hypothetical protein